MATASPGSATRSPASRWSGRAGNRLMAAVDGGQVGKVVVWRLDRLGRTAKGLTALFEDLMHRKVNLISLRDGIDLNTAAGRLMANVLASVAQYETEVRAERVRAGQQAARKRGVKWGGSKKGWRWKVTDDQACARRDELCRKEDHADSAGDGAVPPDRLSTARREVAGCAAVQRDLRCAGTFKR